MPRTFDGTDDTVSFSSGAVSGMTYGTVAMLIRRASSAEVYHALVIPHPSGGTAGGGSATTAAGTLLVMGGMLFR